ncbi:NRPS protein biosynthetic cluster [Salix suchowensis]|nr:NRPS protein biosynthetic cluster [Salix suchowensis]
MKMVDVVIATPSMLFPHDPVDYPNIKVIAVAGEVCPQSTSSDHNRQYYGASSSRIGRVAEHRKPTPNNNVYVLHPDAGDLVPVAIGQPGIMWAGGAGITRGYLNLPAKRRRDSNRIELKCGPCRRWRPDGTLEHLGRIDDQVKIKGFRVELDGVGAAMEAAVALLIGDVLWGFFTPSTVEPKDVQAAVAKIQPYYAVPSRFIHMEEFPNTTNGKVDKRALRRKVQEEIEAATHSDVSESVATTGASESSPTADRELLSKDSSSTLRHLLSMKSASIEKGYEVSWAGYQDDDIPDKTQGKFARNIRHQIFSLYRRLFGVVFVTNVAVLVATFAQGNRTLCNWARSS